VLVCKGAKVSNYGGKSINLAIDHIKYEINPKNSKEANKLIKWFNEQADNKV